MRLDLLFGKTGLKKMWRMDLRLAKLEAEKPIRRLWLELRDI